MQKKLMCLIGDKYSRLTVISEAERKIIPSGQIQRQWSCKCDCGAEVVAGHRHLRSGQTLSCGCLRDEKITEMVTTHGMSGTRFNLIWARMKQRCNNKDDDLYGGRGITYDPRWEDFEEFYNDMYEGYQDNLSLDRINGNENYTKENCRWITTSEQARNRRISKANTSGVTGVSLHTTNSGQYWKASWIDLNGEGHAKFFKGNTKESFLKACQVRKEAIENLNQLGANYSEFHGK